MSYTIYDAKADTMTMFEEALHSEDSSKVYHVANKLAAIPGWDEEANVLLAQARRLQNDDWAYDESVNN